MKRQNKLVIIALLFSAFLLSPFVLTLSAATITLGQTTVGNNSAWQPGGVIVGSKFTATGGTPLSMSVYITQPSSSSNVAKCAIYSESNKQLIWVTEEKTVPAGFSGWLTFNFNSASSLTSGSSYSLVIWLKDSHSTIRYTSGNTAQSWYARQTYTGSFPNGPYNSISGYGQENNVYAIYCTMSSSIPSPSPSPTPSPSPMLTTSLSSTFGQKDQGSNLAWQSANTMVSSRFIASSPGSLSSITVYVKNGASMANYIKCALYSDTTKSLVATSNELTIGSQASGWFTLETTTSPSIIAGQRYSLVVSIKNSNCYLAYASGSTSQSWYTQSSYGNFPSTYTVYGQENTVYSIYATLTSKASSTTTSPTPTPSPSTTTSPIPTPSPTPVPTSITSSKNWAPILGKWGDYHIFGDVCFGDPKTYPQITHADYTTTHNGNPSIRVDGPGIWCNPTREVNHAWVSVKPGDRIIFTCYIKTAYSSVGTGGTIGFDCYGPKERILEVHPRTIQTEIWNGGSRPTGWSGMAGSVIWIPYGSGWTKITLDVTIPYTTYTHNDWQQPLTYGPQQIAGIMPMLCSSWNKGESASIWYADAELYINP